MNSIKPTILIVDDETSIREAFQMVLQDKYTVLVAASGEASLKRIVDEKVDLVFLDIRMPGMDGIETLKRIKSLDDTIEVVMVTAVNDVQKARQSIELGANNYIVKPFDVDQILETAKRLSHKKILKQDLRSCSEHAKKESIENELIGSSRTIKSIQKMIDSFSQKDNPVLIIGENGSEKNIIANLLHRNGSRSQMPYKSFDLSDSYNDILCQMLFGEGKGDSVYELGKKGGLLEECGGGTLVINHIENASPENQELFFELLTKKESRRVGSFSSYVIDIRIIFTSSKDIKTLTDEGTFNKKLFNLFNHSIIPVAPLRERAEDIIQIANSLIEHFNFVYDKNVKELSPDAHRIFLEYSWPGNFKELSGVLEAIFLSDASESINIKDLPFFLLMNSSESRAINSNELEDRFEKKFIQAILGRTNSDIQASSRLLNISPSYLASKIETQ